jgi:hypothetical protein
MKPSFKSLYNKSKSRQKDIKPVIMSVGVDSSGSRYKTISKPEKKTYLQSYLTNHYPK